jgi:hypothetical protein
MKNLLFACTLLGIVASMTLPSATNAEDAAKSKIKYRKGKKIDFKSLLVEGQGKKAVMAVVTGNNGEKDLGLLKLRTNFNDFMAIDAGEEIK